MADTIVVKNGYRGAPSGERLIPPGEYAPDSPALFGLWQYLVQNGHAAIEVLEDKPKVAFQDFPIPDFTESLIREVKAWVKEDAPPVYILELVLRAEIENKNRTALVIWLEKQIDDRTSGVA